jgi:hypothetical protein
MKAVRHEREVTSLIMVYTEVPLEWVNFFIFQIYYCVV